MFVFPSSKVVLLFPTCFCTSVLLSIEQVRLRIPCSTVFSPPSLSHECPHLPTIFRHLLQILHPVPELIVLLNFVMGFPLPLGIFQKLSSVLDYVSTHEYVKSHNKQYKRKHERK